MLPRQGVIISSKTDNTASRLPTIAGTSHRSETVKTNETDTFRALNTFSRLLAADPVAKGSNR